MNACVSDALWVFLLWFWGRLVCLGFSCGRVLLFGVFFCRQVSRSRERHACDRGAAFGRARLCRRRRRCGGSRAHATSTPRSHRLLSLPPLSAPSLLFLSYLMPLVLFQFLCFWRRPAMIYDSSNDIFFLFLFLCPLPPPCPSRGPPPAPTGWLTRWQCFWRRPTTRPAACCPKPRCACCWPSAVWSWSTKPTPSSPPTRPCACSTSFPTCW